MILKQEKKCEEILISLVKKFNENKKTFQLTFYNERSIKAVIFENEKIIQKWYKNSFEKMILSLKDYNENIINKKN